MKHEICPVCYADLWWKIKQAMRIYDDDANNRPFGKGLCDVTATYNALSACMETITHCGTGVPRCLHASFKDKESGQ